MVSHTASGDWQSFELRMRRRRAERLALRADVAADAGYPDDARLCLEEARVLAPELPHLAAIEAKLSRPPRQPVARRLKWAIVTAACLIAFVSGVGTMRTIPAGTGTPAISRVTRPAEAAAVTRPVADSADSDDAAPVRTAGIAAIPERAPSARRLEPLPVVPKVAPAVRPVPAEPRAFTAVNGLPAASIPPPLAMAPVAVPVPAPEIVPAVPAPASPPSEPPQESVVRSVLSRYASAYSALDADAAQRVWPGVNRAALSRAFDSLASQQISLGDCRIDVAASNARARCAGSATWSPKVGGGSTRTEARNWTFELAREASGWQIVSARVQNR